MRASMPKLSVPTMLPSKRHFTIVAVIAGICLLAARSPAHAQCQVAKLTPEEALPNAQFGSSVALFGDAALIGAFNDNGDGSGSAYMFRHDGSTWTQAQKLLPEDGTAGENFGSVSLSGDTAVIGAWRDNENGTQAGAAYAFRYDPSLTICGEWWCEEQKLLPDDGWPFDVFGSDVALDGDIVVIGAPGDDDNGDGSGSAYVFRYNPDNPPDSRWVQEEKLLPDDGAATDQFGQRVAISGDTIVIGAHYHDHNETDAGSAYVFRYNGSNWVQEQELLAEDGAAGDEFGHGASISGDTAIIGAPYDGDNGFQSGSAYVFRYNPDNPPDSRWGLQAPKLLADDGEDSDHFGEDIALSGDTVVIGAHEADVNDDNPGGSAYVFRYDGSSWTQTSKLLACDPASNDQFGGNIALSGETALIGAHWDDDACPADPNCDSGSAYVFNLAQCLGPDCNDNGIPDECEIADCPAEPACSDCNSNGIPDECDIANCLPDDTSCQDCNGNGIPDGCDVAMPHQKISDTQGGFTGTLEDFDWFGLAVASLGDLDGDGPSVLALAVSATGDDSGGLRRGAVWILFLNSNGGVESYHKIDSTSGDLDDDVLDDTDEFGSSLAALGDLDGDGVEDLAVGVLTDDDGGQGAGADTGAVWILFLNDDGTVKASQKISATEGGFTGPLTTQDNFGSSCASLGDLDGDGIAELAVGAHGDNDGGLNTGAVWILFLNDDGTVRWQQKISDTEGGFGGDLHNWDRFGGSLAALGDFDDDGVADLAVGANLDDTGGTDRGAVWVLFLSIDTTNPVQPMVTVKDYHKIDSMSGDLPPGALDDGDDFGRSLALLEDLDGDEINDLAVGAAGDDDGGPDTAAVWILFLNGPKIFPDDPQPGTVKGSQKISATEGCFAGALDDRDFFGIALAFLGDLDGDQGGALAVGAYKDDDGGTDHGAVWILFLEDFCQGCNRNGIPDDCEPDCNANGIPDECDIDDCTPEHPDYPGCADCDGNGIPDACDIAECPSESGECDPESPECRDCNGNGIPDGCDIDACPEICEPACSDCNSNGVPDQCDLDDGCSADDDPESGIPDECEACPADLNGDGCVNASDLAELLGDWGPCESGNCPPDLNRDCSIGPEDLAILLGSWGPCCGDGICLNEGNCDETCDAPIPANICEEDCGPCPP